MIYPGVLDALVGGVEHSLGKQRAKIASALKEGPHHRISDITVSQLYGGLRGVTCVACDTSEVVPETGLQIRGYPVTELAEKSLQAEEIFWLLLTGKFPHPETVHLLKIPMPFDVGFQTWWEGALERIPQNTHPLAAMCIALQHLQRDSSLLNKSASTPKSQVWKLVFEDAVQIVSFLPHVIGSLFHRHMWNYSTESWGTKLAVAVDADRGKPHEIAELMRLYVLVHCDHEGSNACALACRTAASTLADPYLALTAGWRALAGPIHGLASQVCIEFIDEILATLGADARDEQLAAYVQQRIDAGRVVPGFGHAVLRAMDPRYELLHAFAKTHFPDDPAFRIADGLLRVVPPLLQATGKVANPWPNVDGISGVVMKHYGLTDYRWLTVLFAACMSLGLLAQMVVSRGLGEPILHPKAVTPELLRAMVEDR